MDLDWEYRFIAKDKQGYTYRVWSEGNSWTWTAQVSNPQGEGRSLGQFGSGEDAKKACEEAAAKQ